MRPIAEVTDDCESKMKPKDLFSWDEWWEDVIKNGTTPAHKTLAYHLWIKERSYIKGDINKELVRRKSPNRLICPGGGKGIYLVCEDDVAELTADTRVRKIVNCFEKGHSEMKMLAGCHKISVEDKKMLTRLSDLVELQQNTMIGTMSKMRSLPPDTKKRLLKHLGIDT
ncbi:MAG: hypothetical protein KAS32_07545 [Candidatus Peribacteraceae bacterium]|nr:hypothetical protein [Candidatus Peribacteraceae bacterium]